MTPEQLNEIEKLAEAFEEESTIILPLVKAVREAKVAQSEAKQQRDAATEELIAASREIEQLKAERDEARAEAARWKEHLRHIAYEHCDSPVHYAMNQLEDK